MDINLEKIEIVKDRTGSTYAEAKDALEKANGSVVDAIIDIEEKLNAEFNDVGGSGLKDSPVFAKMKEIVDKGNVTRIIIRKGEKTVVNFPLTAGVIGAVLVPWGAILGIVAAVGTQCDIEFVDDKGEIIDINGKVVGLYDKAGEKLQSIGGKGSEKVSEVKEWLGEGEALEDVKETFVRGTAKVMELWDKLEKSGKIDEVRDTVENVAKKAVKTAKDIAKEAGELAGRAESSLKSDAEPSDSDELVTEADSAADSNTTEEE